MYVFCRPRTAEGTIVCAHLAGGVSRKSPRQFVFVRISRAGSKANSGYLPARQKPSFSRSGLQLLRYTGKDPEQKVAGIVRIAVGISKFVGRAIMLVSERHSTWIDAPGEVQQRML